jgi:WD40 repeat protein
MIVKFRHILWFIAFLFSACSQDSAPPTSLDFIASLSVSSGGRYVISASSEKNIRLWDLKTHKSSTISNNGNLFSAYFVKRKQVFLWQGLNNIVHLTNIDGKDVKKWPHFPTYGHVISSDLSKYYSADTDWNIYVGIGDKMHPVKKDGNSPSFLGSGKLINLQLSNDDSALLSCGIGYEFDGKYAVDYRPAVIDGSNYSKLAGVVLWNTKTQKPTSKIVGNVVKTYATFSPDGRYVVSGDENGIVNVWDIKANRLKFMLASIYHGRDISNGKDYSHLTGDDFAKAVFDKTGLIPVPGNHLGESTVSIKFISNKYYLRFFYAGHYVALYQIDNDMPIKYFDLGTDPFPSVREYYRNVSIDSAPEAGILVTGQHRGSGINVYKFDKDKLTLKKIWVTH